MDLRLVVLSALFQLCAAFPISGFTFGYDVGSTYMYDYETEVVLNEPLSSKQTLAVGYRLTGSVKLTNIWHGGSLQIIELVMSNTKLYSTTRGDVLKDLKSLLKLPLYFVWSDGKVGTVYASEEDATLAINIKKGIAALFQLQKQDGQRKEVDTSGECDVYYQLDNKKIHKTKFNCQNLEIAGLYSNVNSLLGVTTDSTATTTYTLEEDIINTITASESYVSRVNMRQSLSVGVSSRQYLSMSGIKRGSQTYSGGSADEVIQSVNKAKGLGLFRMMLGTDFDIKQCTPNCGVGSELVKQLHDELLNSNMAQESASHAFLQLVESFRKMNKELVLEILKSEDNQDIIPQLIDVATAAQTSACQSALMEFLDFSAEDDISRPERYLLATAFSTHPGENLLEDLLNLYKKKVPDPRLRESIGESLGAVLNTFCHDKDQCQSPIVQEVQKAILDELELCEEEGCKSAALYALSNAGLSNTLPKLLAITETSDDAGVQEAAIKALRRINKKYITEEVKAVMRRVYHQNNKQYDTAVRALALKTLLANSPTPSDLKAILLSTTDQDQHEMSTYVKARLFSLMEQDKKIKEMVENILKDWKINNYHVLAQKGKSLAFTEILADTESATATYDMYTLNSKAGILKRSGMDVVINNADNSLSVFSIGIFAAGMESLMGEEVEVGQEDTEATAGLALNLLDVSLRPVTFFKGQGGLMSAVWNAPSEPVSALQANLLLQDHYERLHLQNGFIADLNVQGSVSIDLSGSISISLWYKTANSLIQSSGAVAIKGKLSLDTSAFESFVNFDASAKSVINFQSDVDFSDGVKSCLQMFRPSHVFSHVVTKYEHIRGFKKSYKYTVRRKVNTNEASFPLPQLNAKQCRLLAAMSEG